MSIIWDVVIGRIGVSRDMNIVNYVLDFDLCLRFCIQGNESNVERAVMTFVSCTLVLSNYSQQRCLSD